MKNNGKMLKVKIFYAEDQSLNSWVFCGVFCCLFASFSLDFLPFPWKVNGLIHNWVYMVVCLFCFFFFLGGGGGGVSLPLFISLFFLFN